MVLAIAPLQWWVKDATDQSQLALQIAVIVGIGAASYATSMFVLWEIVGRPDGLESHVADLLMRGVRKVRIRGIR
jgi:hypothetical protein